VTLALVGPDGSLRLLQAGPLLLLATALAWYAGVRALVDAMPARRWRVAGLAIAMSLPAAALSALMLRSGQADVAVAVVFANAVSAMSLALGVTLLGSEIPIARATPRRWWLALVPVAAVAMFAGLAGAVRPVHVAAMIAMAVVVRTLMDVAPSMRHPPADPVEEAGRSSRGVRAVQAVLAVALVVLGAWLARAAIGAVEADLGRSVGSVLATIVFGPAAALPMIGAASAVLVRGHSDDAVGSLVATAVFSLCVTLPVLAVATIVAQWPADQSILATLADPPGLAFPMRTWRIDSVLLLVLAIAIAPAAIGRWTLARLEGVLLVAIYIGYLFATVAAAV
jgi:Ca2+/Na+ antiporter